MEPKILVVDDHSMMRKGLKLLLQGHIGLMEVHEAVSCHELMKEIRKTDYTHMILDILLSDGSALEVLPHIRAARPDLKIMIFSMCSSEVYGRAMKQYGISYYVPKTTQEDDLIRILRQFVENESLPWFNPERDSNNPFTTLTGRELEILHYVLQGIGTKAIAGQLNIRMNTVSGVKNRIFEKTQTANLKELIELASLYNCTI